MTRIVIYAVGSPIAIDVLETCRRCGHQVAAGIRNIPGDSYLDSAVSLLEADAVTGEIARLPFILPLFDPANRRSALADARRRGFGAAFTLVDPTSILAATTQLSEGVYVNAGCVIGGEGEIGAFALVNRGANIGHHARIAAFASIGPGAILAGSVHVGEDAVIGVGAIILPKISIGAGARVAPGAVVTRDVPEHGFAGGNPARIRHAHPGRGDG